MLDGDRIIAGVEFPSTASGARQRGLTRGRLGGRFGRPRSLRGRSRSSWLLDLATNDAGDAVAAVRWCHTAGCGRQSLQLVRWRAGAKLGKPQRIARGRGLGAAVALNARGDVAVVWDRVERAADGSAVYGRVITASGRVRPRRLLGHAPAALRYRQIALTSTRRVVETWVAQDVNECFANPGEIAVAKAGPGGRFTGARRLARLRISGCGRYVQDPAWALPAGRTAAC